MKTTLMTGACIAIVLIACGGPSSRNRSSTGGSGGVGDTDNASGGTGGSRTGGTRTGGTGGKANTGGTTATGGKANTGGTSATGGAPATGGAAATGGTPATGGVAATGGTPATGGAAATGGTPATGGVAATGGTPATGGIAATGATPATGGIAATGGTPATGGAGGPVARWTFDEGSGTTVADSTGNGNTMTLACVAPCVDGVGGNGLPDWSTGHNGNGVQFVYYQVGRVAPSPSIAGMASAYTISAWVRRVIAHTGGDRSLWGRQAAVDSTEQLGAMTVDAGIIAAIGGGIRVTDANAAPGASVWFHLAQTWDGTTLRLYRDGALIGSAAMTSTAMANSLGGFVLGTRQQGTGLVGYADAVFDDVTLWNRALSAQEITALTQ